MVQTSIGEIHIVAIAEGNIDSFRECLDSVARERVYLGGLEAPPPAAVGEFVRSNIAQDFPQFVALTTGTVIGWCDVIPHRSSMFSHCGRLGMGVRRDYRGRGIGRRLAEATIEKAAGQGLERIELEVFASNAVAIRLYEKLGFVVEGVKKRARKLDGIYDDVVEMVRFTQ